MKIAIIGAGVYGTALGGVLAENKYNVEYYDKKNEELKLEDVLSGASYYMICVPSNVVPLIVPDLPKDIPMIMATKGVLSDEIFRDYKDYMVISGPGFADDIKNHQETHLTATDQRVIDLFTTDYLDFDYTDDNKGVLMCGALKNVYAVQAGYLGLERDSDEWLDYIDKATGEMKAILELNDAKASTVDHACGIGDLKLTCGYPSRNYEFGDKYSHDSSYRPEKTVEGLSTLKLIKDDEIKIPANIVILKEIMNAFKC